MSEPKIKAITSPSGQVRITVPGEKRPRWSVAVRGRELAAGEGWDSLSAAARDLPDRLRREGFEVAADEIQRAWPMLRKDSSVQLVTTDDGAYVALDPLADVPKRQG